MPYAMKHVWTLILLLGALPALAGAQTPPTIAGHQAEIQAPLLQGFLDQHFPQSYDALHGLYRLTITDPRISLPPGDRLHMRLTFDGALAGSHSRPLGTVALNSGLRFDPQTAALYLQSPALDDPQPQDGQQIDARTRELVDLWLADYARKQPIYRFDPALLEQMGTLRVESATVENGRIVVRFNQDIGDLALPGASDD